MRTAFLTAALTLGLALSAHGQASTTVPATHPVYGVLRSLHAAGIVDTAVMSQLPLSRREIARMLAEGRRNLGRVRDTTWLAATIDRLSLELAPDTARFALGALAADLTHLDSPSRGIDPDGNGEIDVQLNPLIAHREGRRFADGQTLALEPRLRAQPASWLALEFEPRAMVLRPRGGDATIDGDVQRLYARAVIRNVALTVGRDQVAWGHGERLGLVNSTNPRPLDMIRAATDHPFRLPWLLRYLGPLQFTSYLADLGERQDYPHAKLAAYKLSGKPLSFWELSAHGMTHFGGRGAPSMSFAEWIVQVAPLLDQIWVHESRQLSNRFAGIDMLFRIPRARGLELYWHGLLDDWDTRRIRSTFTEDAGYTWGAAMSCLTACGQTRVEAEYRTTGIRFYTHRPFSSGLTLDERFIGDPLGPRGRGGYLRFTWTGVGGAELKAEAAHEARSGNRYHSETTGTEDRGFHFVLDEARPTERRWRMTARSTTSAGSGRMVIGAGLERVENFAHRAGEGRTNLLLSAGFELRP
jgi:hypothetical protein